MMSLLVGGPLSGQHLDMPDDELTTKVDVPNSRPARYARLRVAHDGKETEVWGWAPLCYKRVKAHYLHLIDS